MPATPSNKPRPPRPRSLSRGISWEPWKRADGRWVPSFRIKFTVGGLVQSVRLDNQADAEDFAAKLRLDRRKGALAEFDRGRITLEAFIREEYWPDYASVELDRRTLTGYRHWIDAHILDRLGHLALRDISVRVIARFKRDLVADEVGAPTIRKTMGVLQGILAYAVQIDELEHNPARSVKKPPAKSSLRAIDPPAPSVIEDIRVRVDLTSSTLIAAMAYAGLRPQEALALEWRHVGERQLVIEQKNVDGDIVQGQKVKGKRARTVPMLDALARAFAEYRRSLPYRPRRDQLVFPNALGEPWDDEMYRRWRKRVWGPAKRAAVGPERRIRPYDLRHAHGSLRLYEGKYSPAEIAAMQGHSLETFLKDYAHIITDIASGAGKVDPDQMIADAREAAIAEKATRDREQADRDRAAIPRGRELIAAAGGVRKARRAHAPAAGGGPDDLHAINAAAADALRARKDREKEKHDGQ